MDIFKYLFESPTRKNKISNSALKKLARKSGIIYLNKDMYGGIRQNYGDISKGYLTKLQKLVSYRGGKIIQNKDLEILSEIIDHKKLTGGNYDGYCDGVAGQCSDAVMCGGYDKNIDSFIVPHQGFGKILKNILGKQKISKRLSLNLHKLVEYKINRNLIKAKELANSQGRKLINLGDFLSIL